MHITTIGIDLAKPRLRLVGTDQRGKILLRKTAIDLKYSGALR